MKSTKIVLEPSTLILQLNRYEYNREQNQTLKKHNQIECPKKVTMPNGSSYSLSSVVNHIGDSPKEGHYNMLFLNKYDDTFVLLDDSSIKFDVGIDTTMKKMQYLMVYIKEL